MVLATSLSRMEYEGDGVATVFPYNFVIFDASHMDVMIGAPGEVPVPAVGFTVSGAGSYDGGAVTFATAPPADTWVILRRVVPVVQETDFRNQARFFAETHERTFDYSRMVDQQLNEQLGRSLSRVSDQFAWDAKGSPIGNVDTAQNATQAPNLGQVSAAIAAAAAEVEANSLARDNALEANSIARDNALGDRIDTEEGVRAAADANLQAQISGGAPLEASAFSPISWHDQEISNSVTIPNGKNAWSFGPEMAIAPGQVVTIGDGSFWTIASGEVSE